MQRPFQNTRTQQPKRPNSRLKIADKGEEYAESDTRDRNNKTNGADDSWRVAKSARHGADDLR